MTIFDHHLLIGATRRVRRFLFLPRVIDGEWRWLCTAAWEQGRITSCINPARSWWVDVRWLPNDAPLCAREGKRNAR